MNQNGRPWYLWPLIAFVVGFLIGWLVIGWVVWPVTWTNALVQDLRADLRDQYVTMVAESYAQTGNLDQAQRRLEGWSTEQLTRIMSDAQKVLAVEDADAARSVQGLAAALGAAAGGTGAAPGQSQVPTRAAAAASSPAPGTASTFGRLCAAGLFVFLAIAALALLIFLFRRWRLARGEGSTGGSEAPFDALETYTAPAAAAEQEKARWSGSEPPVKDDWRLVGESVDTETRSGREGAAGIDSRPGFEDERLDTPLRPVGPPPAAAGWSAPAEPRQPAPVTPVSPASPAVSGLQKLFENMAVYQMGEPDYDEAFDINDPVDGFMGQCGLQLAEPFGRERDQAVALQVWLWDSRDPDTQARVLMSEGAYRDTSLRSEHEGEHGALSVKPGTEFELQSHDLLLRGRVEKVSYAEAEPPRGVFAALHVKLTVYRRG